MELLAREQEITSLNHKLSVMETDLEKAEGKLADAKHDRESGDSAKNNAEALTRKIQLLEEELDAAEKNLKDTVEKYVVFVFDSRNSLSGIFPVLQPELCFLWKPSVVFLDRQLIARVSFLRIG